MQIEVIVRDKIARTANKHDFAVCGNSDYTIKFNFDSEWDAYEAKTARFKWNGSYTDVVFVGSECPMPIITNAFRVEIGVYAGELHTTSSAVLPLRKSILCGNETESEVSQEIKENLDNLLKEKIDCPQTANVNDFLAVEETDEDGKPTKWKTKTQVQSDWNENDETAKGYVKNRPFWTGDPVKTVLLEETELSLENGGAELPTIVKLEEGQIYDVTYNGTVYKCTAWLDEEYGYVFIGNGMLIDISEGGEEPFFTDGEFILCEADEPVTIKIIGLISEVHQIDEKYIPDSTRGHTTIHALCQSEEKGLYYEKIGDVLVYDDSYNNGSSTDRAVVRYYGGRLFVPDILKTHSSEYPTSSVNMNYEKGFPDTSYRVGFKKYTLSDRRYDKTLWLDIIFGGSDVESQHIGVPLSMIKIKNENEYTATGTFVSVDGTIYAVIYQQYEAEGTLATVKVIKKG